ncbi:MAG: hypothetical protein Q4G03_03270 [Planctomycetia bacterium]|nr:hypothetical protein [Planctomycetia bacterium]
MLRSSSHTFATELQDLVQFTDSLSMSSENRRELNAIVSQLNAALHTRDLKLQYFSNALADIRFRIRYLLFDLKATTRERDAYRRKLDESSQSDHR